LSNQVIVSTREGGGALIWLNNPESWINRQAANDGEVTSLSGPGLRECRRPNIQESKNAEFPVKLGIERPGTKPVVVNFPS
jgi:hypothetical protein